MSPKNAKFIRDVSQICADFVKYLKGRFQSSQDKEVAVDVIEVLAELDLYRVNFAKLLEFFQHADLARKISGFIQSQQN